MERGFQGRRRENRLTGIKKENDAFPKDKHRSFLFGEIEDCFLLLFGKACELRCAAPIMRDIGHNEMRLFQHPFVAVGNGETFRGGFNAIGQKGRKGIRKLFCGEIGKHHRTANVGVVLHEFRQSGTHHCIKCAMIADIEGINGLRFNEVDEGLL